MGIISKLRHLLSPNEIKNIYYSYVQSHLLYGIIIWGNAKNSSLNNINKLLYKCSALMTFSTKKTGVKKLLELHILDIHQLYTLETCKLIYKFTNNNLPRNLMSLFQLTSSHHTHGTRNAKHNSLTLPMATSNKTKSLITFSGPQNWNKYCLNMTETNSKQ